MNWSFETSGQDGAVTLFGVNIFDYSWQSTGRTAEVRDPLHQERFRFPIYAVEINRQRQEFAAGEFSNCIWGFYLPEME